MPGTTFDIDAIAAGGGRVLRFENGAAIYGRGDPGDCAFIVARGRVRIGNGVPIEILRPGEIFGEDSLIDASPRMATATATGPTEVVVIEPDLFFLLCRDDSDFSDAVMRLMARRLRATLSALDRVTGDGRPDLRVIAGG
jgi:CRP-like cAMP-binding protein